MKPGRKREREDGSARETRRNQKIDGKTERVIELDRKREIIWNEEAVTHKRQNYRHKR